MSKTPFQTVRADYPHTAYGRSFRLQHYAAPSQKARSGKRMVPRRR
jgi:hypothetical protein